MVIPESITITVFAQNTRSDVRQQIFSDTISRSKSYSKHAARSNAFYDSLQTRQYKNIVSRSLARWLIRSNDNNTDSSRYTPQIEVSRNYFNDFSGARIEDINIVQANVFTRDSTEKVSRVERFIDNIHLMTKEKTIRKNLLFNIGDTINPYEMAINEEIFRSLPYVSTAYFVITANPDTLSGGVKVNIFVRDTWSLNAELSWSSAPYISVFDRNFIGSGNMLGFKYYHKHADQNYGAEAFYNINNLWGTFTNVAMRAGIGETNSIASIQAERPFILPSDHIWGLQAGFRQANAGMSSIDSVMLINRIDYGLWYGYSWNINPKVGTNIFSSFSATMVQFNKRPYIMEGVNPYYYNRISLLANLGISRQNYFQSNMIYGYGRMEDIPYGFKCELIGGVEWNEILGRRYYLAVGGSAGDMTPIGYLEAGVGAGTFINDKHKAEQAMIHGAIKYFSPLLTMGSFNIRQFINVMGTWGINRLWGEQELLNYQDISGIRGLGSSIYTLGYNRFTIGLETVIFTPIFIYDFRFAFYLWSDIGWLGYDKNVFNNALSLAIGIGVRIKNERLMFSSLQLSLGFAIRKSDLVGYNPFGIATENALITWGFKPTQPKILEYR